MVNNLTPERSISSPDQNRIRPIVQLIDHPREVEESLRPYVSLHDIDIISGSQQVGVLKLKKTLKSDRPDHPRPRVAMIEEIRLENTNDIGKGYGKATYLELLKSLGDMPLMSAIINDFSEAIWKSLVRDGLAEEDFIEVNGQRKMVGYISLPEVVRAKLLIKAEPDA